MQFANFSKSIDGLTITLYNESPITRVSTIKFYSDNASGTFEKKEFRWSFNNVYWSNWQPLTQNAISRIDTHGNYYFFLQVRYILSASGSGTVSSFKLNYTEGTATITTNIHEQIEDPDSSALVIHDYIQRYEITTISDASLLNGYPGSYYLDRSHHIGRQTIGSIIGLQTILDNLVSASGVTQFYVDGSLATIKATYIPDVSLNATYFKWINGFLEPSASGDVTKEYVDGSLATRDASISDVIEASTYFYFKTQIDASFATNASVNKGINNVKATYIPDISLNISYFKWIGGYLEPSVAGGVGDVTKEYVDGSLNKYVLKTGDTMTGTLFNTSTGISLDVSGNIDLAYMKGIRWGNKDSFIYEAASDMIYVVTNSLNSGIFAAQGIIAGNGNQGNAFMNRLIATDVSPGFSFIADEDTGLGWAGANQLSLIAKNIEAIRISDVSITIKTLLDLTNHNIIGVKTPISSSDAVNKFYVDASFATNVSVGLAFLTNVSLGLAGTGGMSRANVDASFATNASVNIAFLTNVSLGSAVQTASNVGSGDASIFRIKLGNDLQFRKIIGSGAATVTNTDDTITVSINASFGGEVNTASNLGSGEGLYYQKIGSDLQFKSLKSTNNTISFSNDASQVYIDASLDYYTRPYIDGSLNLKTNFTYDVKQDASIALKADITYVDNSIANFATNASVNFAFSSNTSLGLAFNQYINASLGLANNIITNVSLGTLSQRVDYLDACLGPVSSLTYALNSSLGAYATNSSINNTFLTNTSLGATSALATALNSSIGNYALTSQLTKTDTSLYNVSLLNNSNNASVGILTTQLGKTDTSLYSVSLLNNSNNASIGILTTQLGKTDTSLYVVATSLTKTDASLYNVSLLTNALNTSVGWLDASVKAAFTKNNAQDASIIRLDASMSDVLEASTYFYFKTQIDASFALITTTNTFATNASVGLAFLTNTSLGNVSQLTYALNTSMGGGLGSYATNASVNLSFLTNTSLGNVSQLTYALNTSMGGGLGSFATNSSVNTAIANFATNASVNLAFLTNPSLGGGDVTKAYVDVCLGYAFASNASLGSAIQTASNIGDGSAGVFKQVSGSTLQFRKLAGAGAAVITEGTDVITVSLDASFAGEVNTASNVGAGEGIYDQKVGSNLQFKSLKSNTGSVYFGNDASQVYIDVSDYVSKFYVDNSISNFATNASVNLSFLTNTSLGLANNIVINTSLGNVSQLTYALNTSMGGGLGSYATNASVNLALYSNVSLGLTFNQYTNASLGLANNIITNTSLGNVSQLTYALNSSIGLYATNVSVNNTLVNYTTKTYVDACINTEKQKWIDINRCGFISEEDVSLSFNPTTYVLTLHKVNDTWTYMRAGIEYTFSSDVSVQIGDPPSKGMYYIIINNNNGILSSSTEPWTLMDSTLPVATVNWDSSLSPTYQFAEEKHQSLIDRRTHAWMHFAIGTRFVSGGTLSGPTVGGTTNLTNVFGVSQTVIADDDMFETLPSLISPDGSSLAYTCFFRTNSSTWVWRDSSVPYLYGGNNRIYWDQNGELTEATNTVNRWYNWYLIYTNIYGRARYGLFPGRAIFTSLAAAQAENVTSFDFTGFPIAESVIAYQFSWEYVGILTNQGKVRLGANPVKVNTATITSVGSGASTDHNSLAGLQGGTTDQYYHLTETQYNDYAGKTYVDSSIINTLLTNASLGNISELTYALNSSIGTYATNASINLALFSNSSLGLAFNQYTNVSLGLVSNIAANASLGYISDFVYVLNTSIGVVSGNLVKTDTSLYNVNLLSNAHNASIGIITTQLGKTDASLFSTSILVSALNTSMGGGLGSYATNSSVNQAFITNASLGILTQKVNYIDACLGPVSSLTYVINTSVGNLNSSLGLYVAKAGDTMTGDLTINTSLNVNGNINGDVSSYYYLGREDIDGSWRWFIDVSGNLKFEKRESSVWAFKGKFV